MSVQKLQAAAPQSEHAKLQSAMASVPVAEQPRVAAVLGSLIDTIKAMGLSINWGCLFQIIPQAMAAFGNPALWPSVIMAYFTCANPPGSTATTSGS
jgi:hypothetical protein